MTITVLNGYTRFERARILGARALQLAEGAPALIECESEAPIDVARAELEADVIPIGIRRDN